ncbi:PIN domain-containing protein [Phenylobacterium sp.]|uniref:PIN domain-containing protein n=1 Tax=Phenylobacterium sp. TaxID=1871053 RepID=UPI0030F4261E
MIVAVLDADVLYPLPLRDTLLSAAAAGCFQPRWSVFIVEEATRNLVADGRLTAPKAKRLRATLDLQFEDAFVEGHEPLILTMPNHVKDRHVAACAVQGGASLIVTSNLKDFAKLPPGVTAISPDDFLCLLLEKTPQALAVALTAQVARLKNPPMTLEVLLDRLAELTPSFVAAWKASSKI